MGAGYTAQCMIAQLKVNKNLVMHGTTRSKEHFKAIESAGASPLFFGGEKPSIEGSQLLREASNILISISPKQQGDITLLHHREDIKANKNLVWLGYLSTVGVYGNHEGAWVDEESETRPTSQRSIWRKFAEDQWLDLYKEMGLPVHIFRLPGIYGRGRGPQNKLKTGTARRINKPGQFFNRAHVSDIASVLALSMNKPNPGSIYNVVDDEPAPPQDVLAYTAELMGIKPPPLISFEDADLTDMARSFYTDNKRVSNKKIKSELGAELKYPTYREGIKASL